MATTLTLTSNSMRAEWTDPNRARDVSYFVQFWRGNGPSPGNETYPQAPEMPALSVIFQGQSGGNPGNLNLTRNQSLSDGQTVTVTINRITPGGRHGVFAYLAGGRATETLNGPPESPSGLSTGAVAEKSATFSWNAAEDATGYEVKLSSSGSWTSVGTALTYTFTGLMPGSRYRLQVRAVNSYGESPAVSIETFTSVPAVMLGATDTLPLKYEIVLLDDSKLDISRRVLEFEYDYGAQIDDPLTPPSWIKSQGALRLNNFDHQYGWTDLAGWVSVNVYAVNTLVFAMSIDDAVISDDDDRIEISVEGLAASRIRLKTPVQVNTGLDDLTVEQYLLQSGLPFDRFLGVTLPRIFVAAGSAYDALQPNTPAFRTIEPRFTTDVATFIDHVSALGSLLAFEDPIKEHWNMYPIPPSGDARSASATIRSSTELIREDYRFEDIVFWQRDAWVLETLNAATKINSGTYRAEGSSSALKTVTFDGGRYTSVLRFKLTAQTRILAIKKISNIDFRRASNSSHFNGTVSHLGNLGDTVYIRATGVNASWKISFSYQLVVETFATERPWEIFADDVTVSDLGYLPTSTIPIPRHGTNFMPSLTAARAVLTRWANWHPQTAFITLLLTTNLTHLLRKPGEVVNVVLGENIDHRALIARVRIRQRGLKPIQLAWDLILVGPRPSAAPSQPDPRQLEWGGSPVMLQDEEVYHGRSA